MAIAWRGGVDEVGSRVCDFGWREQLLHYFVLCIGWGGCDAVGGWVVRRRGASGVGSRGRCCVALR